MRLRAIAAFYVPLALSWLLMAIESPVSVSILSRSQDAKTLTAGFLILMAVSLWIESPVIDLLSTATTLGKSRAAVARIRAFAWQTMALVTVAHAAVSLTPIYDWLLGSVLGVPSDVLAATRWPLAIMIPWSACIGWRRWRQGVMIRAGNTKPITLGTLIRLVSLVGVGNGLLALTPLDGLTIAATALVASVFCEAVYIHFAALPSLRALPEHDSADASLSAKKLWSFHLPLTASTLVMMTTTPLVGAALSRANEPVVQMAAWQVTIALSFLFRVATFGLTELVITLAKTEDDARQVRRFCLTLGAGLAGLMVVMWLFGLERWFYATALSADPAILPAASLGFIASCLQPLFGGMLGYMKGRLTSRHLTFARLIGITANLVALMMALEVGLRAGWPGVIIAATALVCSQVAELGTYVVLWRRSQFSGPR